MSMVFNPKFESNKVRCCEVVHEREDFERKKKFASFGLSYCKM